MSYEYHRQQPEESEEIRKYSREIAELIHEIHGDNVAVYLTNPYKSMNLKEKLENLKEDKEKWVLEAKIEKLEELSRKINTLKKYKIGKFSFVAYFVENGILERDTATHGNPFLRFQNLCKLI